MSKDDTYYCEAMVILMDEVLFKIPRFVFQDSEVFEHMFTVPPPTDTVVDGTDDKHPLRLDGHRAEDFKQFLRVVLPTSTIAKEPTTWQQWSSVLKLSTMWGFNAVREKAIKNISSSDIQSLDQIILAKKYGVSSWLVPTLQKLAQQDEPLNFDDARRLSAVAGWEFTLQLGHLRETYSKSGPFKYCDLGWSACGQCGTSHYVRCITHNAQLHFPGPTSQAVVQWPCNTCTTYRCINNPTAYSWEKPAETRAAHDFRPAIQKIFDIDD